MKTQRIIKVSRIHSLGFLQWKRAIRSFKGTFWQSSVRTTSNLKYKICIFMSILQKAQAHSWLAHKFYPQHDSTFYTSKLEAAATGDGHFVSLLCHSIDNPLCQGDDNCPVLFWAYPDVSYHHEESLNKIFSIKLHSHFFYLFVWVTAESRRDFVPCVPLVGTTLPRIPCCLSIIQAIQEVLVSSIRPQ